MVEGSRKESKITIFVILRKVSFDPVDVVLDLFILANVFRFHSGSCVEDLVILNIRFFDVVVLVKEGFVLLKGGDIVVSVTSQG